MTESEPLPTDWPTEPLPDRPVVWDGARFDAMLHEHVQARSPWDLPDLVAGRLRWEYEPFDDRGTRRSHFGERTVRPSHSASWPIGRPWKLGSAGSLGPRPI
jgi:hypothetical protein